MATKSLNKAAGFIDKLATDQQHFDNTSTAYRQQSDSRLGTIQSVTNSAHVKPQLKMTAVIIGPGKWIGPDERCGGIIDEDTYAEYTKLYKCATTKIPLSFLGNLLTSFPGISYVEGIKTRLGYTSFDKTSQAQWIEILELYDFETFIHRYEFPTGVGVRPIKQRRAFPSRWSKNRTAMFDLLINASVISLAP